MKARLFTLLLLGAGPAFAQGVTPPGPKATPTAAATAPPGVNPAAAPAAAPATAPAAAPADAAAPAVVEPAPATAPPPVQSVEPVVAAPLPAQQTGQVPQGEVEAYTTDHLAPARTHEDAKFFFGGQWDMGLPMGSTKDFVGNFGVAGFSFDARYLGFGPLTFGVMGAWQTLSDKSDQTLVQDNVTLSGTQVRLLSLNPIYARLHYSMWDIRKREARGRPVPYAAFNFGGAHVVRRVDLGVWTFSADSWHWALGPEIGLQLPYDQIVVTASARFNYLFSAGDGPEQAYLTFSLGLGTF